MSQTLKPAEWSAAGRGGTEDPGRRSPEAGGPNGAREDAPKVEAGPPSTGSARASDGARARVRDAQLVDKRCRDRLQVRDEGQGRGATPSRV